MRWPAADGTCGARCSLSNPTLALAYVGSRTLSLAMQNRGAVRVLTEALHPHVGAAPQRGEHRMRWPPADRTCGARCFLSNPTLALAYVGAGGALSRCSTAERFLISTLAGGTAASVGAQDEMLPAMTVRAEHVALCQTPRRLTPTWGEDALSRDAEPRSGSGA